MKMIVSTVATYVALKDSTSFKNYGKQTKTDICTKNIEKSRGEHVSVVKVLTNGTSF